MAALAGVPRQVIEAARDKLERLERETHARNSEGLDQLPLFQEPAPDPLRDRLDALDPDNMTPRQALEILYQLKELSRKGNDGRRSIPDAKSVNSRRGMLE